MREMVAAGCSIAEVAKRLDRTYAATAQRLSTLGIATRAPRYTPDMIIMKRYKLKKAIRCK